MPKVLKIPLLQFYHLVDDCCPFLKYDSIYYNEYLIDFISIYVQLIIFISLQVALDCIHF